MSNNINQATSGGPGDPKSKKEALAKSKELASKARNLSLQKQLGLSAFGTADSTGNWAGIDYTSRGFGKAAKGSRDVDWSLNPLTLFGTTGAKYEGAWSRNNAPEDMALKAFEQQSIEDLAYDTVVGFSKRAGAGFIDSVAAWDVSNMTAMSMNKTNHDYSNWLNKIGKKLSDNANTENQIYQDPNESIWNAPYLANQVQQLGYTAGIVAEMVAENIALDWMTGGAQNIASIPTKMRMLSRLAKDASFGMMQGVKEAHMNALETQNTVFEKYKQLGFSDEEALIKSREAANLHFKTEAGALAVMNSLQNVMFLGSLSRATGKAVKNVFKPNEGFKLGFSDAFQTVGEKAVGGITSRIGNKTIQKGVNKVAGNTVLAGSEAIEEVIQGGIGKYAESTIAGEKFDLGEFLSSNEARDSAIGGAFGGLLLGAGFKAVTNYRNRGFNKDLKNFIEDTTNRSSQAYEAHAKAEALYNQLQTDFANEGYSLEGFKKVEQARQAMESAKNTMHAAAVMSSLQFDYGKKSGSTVAFDMYVKHLQNTLDAARSGDTQVLKDNNILDSETGKERFEGVIEDIKNTFEEKIEDAFKLKELYEYELSSTTTDFGIATDIVGKKYQAYKNEKIIDKNLETLREIDTQLAELGLSPQGIERARLKSELKAVQSNKKLAESEEGKAIIEDIKTRLEHNSEYSREDRRVLRRNGLSTSTGLPAVQSIYSENYLINEVNDALYDEAIKESDPKEIEKKIIESKKKRIKKAKTKEEIQEVKDEVIAETGVVPKDIEEAARKKETEIIIEGSKTDEEIAKAEATPSSVKPTPTGAVSVEDTDDILGDINDMFDSEAEVDSIEDILSQFQDEAIEGILNSRQTGSNEKINKFIDNLNKFYQRKEGRDATLEDMIHEFAALSGLENVRRKYNNLIKELGNHGVDINDAQNIYNTFFVLPTDILDDISEDDAIQRNEATVQKVSEITAPKEVGPNGNVIIKPLNLREGRTSNPDIKAAHNYLNSTRDSESNWVVTTDTLQASPLVGNMYGLDPEYLQELYDTNAELEVRIVDDPSVKMSYLDRDGNTVSTTWGEVRSKIGVNKERFANAVPMVIYHGDTPLFPIHNLTWYNEYNVQGNSEASAQEVIEEGIRQLTDLRQKVYKGSNKVKLSTFRVGNIDKLNQHINNTPRSLAEAAGPDSHIAVFTTTANTAEWRTDKNTLLTDKLKDSIILGDNLNKRPSGTILEFRKFGKDPNTGKDIYIALEVMNHSPIATGNMKNNLSEDIFNNVKYATLASVLLENKSNTKLQELIEGEFNFTLHEAEQLRDTILQTTKIDIGTDAKSYVHMFLGNIDLNKRTSPEMTYFEKKDFLLKDKKIEGIQFFNGDNKSSIFGKFENSYTNTVVKDLVSYLKDTEEQPALLRKAKFSVNLSSMHKSFNQINAEGRITDTTPKAFSNFIKENLYTNVLSHEITDRNGETKWITDVQPMVYFESIMSQKTPKASETDINDDKGVEVKPEETSSEVDINFSLEVKYEKLDETLKADLLSVGLTKEDIQTMIATGALESRGVSKETVYESRITYSEEVGRKFDAISTNKISVLTEEEHKELVQSLTNMVASKLDFSKKVTLKSISDNIKTVVEESIGQIIKDTQSRITNLSKLPELADIVENQKEYLAKMQAIYSEQDNLTRFSKTKDFDDNILEVGDVVKEFTRLFSTKLDDIEEIDNVENSSQDQAERDSENYSKAAYELNALDTLDPDIKLILLGLPVKKVGSNELKLNTLGLQEYNKLGTTLDKLREVTSMSRSDWGQLMDLLQSKYKSTNNPIYSQIKDKLKNSEEHIKNEILNKLIQYPTSFNGVMISNETVSIPNEKDIVTKVNTTILNESNSKEQRDIRNMLHKDFYLNQMGNLGYVKTNNAGQKVLDLEYTQDKLDALIALRNKEKEGYEFSDAEYRIIFNQYGLGRISNNTLKEFTKKENYGQTVFSQDRIFDFIERQLRILINEETKLRENGENLNMELKDNSIFALANSQVIALVNKEIELNGTAVAKSTRIGDITVQGTSNTTMIQDILNDLKETDSDKLALLSQTKLGENNFILRLLTDNADFRDKTELSWFSPRAIKLHGRENFGNSEITSLGELDYRSALFAMYANKKGVASIKQDQFDLNFRYARMTPTTFADKGNMMLWNTAVLDLQRGQLEFDEQGNISLNPLVADFLFEQLFLPEFNRIVEAYEMQQKGSKTDIIGYDSAATQFIGMPIFNDLVMNIDGVEMPFNEVVFNNGKLGKTDPLFYKEQAIAALEDWLTYNLNTKISPDGQSGKLVDIGMYNPNPKKITVEVKSGGEAAIQEVSEVPYSNLETTFINAKPGETPLEKFRFTMAEYEINTLLNQNNIYSIFLGDQAFYSKDGFIARQSGGNTYQDTSEAISLVIDKRAAMLIAPGTKFANSELKGLVSEGDRNLLEYHQIFVNDVEEMTDYIDKYLQTQYGEITEAQQKNIDNIREYNKEIDSLYDQFVDAKDFTVIQDLENKINSLTKLKEKQVKELKDTAPEIADYFKITGTDAQEYSTWRSHLDALYRKGSLTTSEREQVKSAYEKLSQGKFDEVSKEEYAVIMQPLKTVYTNLIEYKNPITGAVLARPMYIKSSTIPLLPHVTRNTNLDAVREKLEQIEEKKKTMVKMSYQTANKIGATKTSLTMKDLYHKPLDMLFKEETDGDTTIYSGLLEKSMVTLPTAGLRIQQETPYKQGKYFDKGEDPHISMGSQFMKIIMGNGMNRLGAVFNTNYFSSEMLASMGLEGKKKLTGKDLEHVYTEAYKEYSNLTKKLLFEEFGVDPDLSFNTLNREQKYELLSNIAKVLQKEIIGKNYPEYMEDSLKVSEEHGGFDLPLFFDANTQKFESLLQAIISNRLISHKLPGNGHISASSEGFEFKKTLDELSDSDREGIVYVDENNTSLAPTYFIDENGNRVLKKSRVLIPSHYAYMKDGVWTEIDWTSDKYSSPIYKDGKIVGRKINLDMIDPELLDMFAFRIPTSSHQSGVIIEVAGFLPKQMGDTLVVPKEHTTQLGEDYDIDKRYVYKNNYYVDKEGNIKKVKYSTDQAKDTDNIGIRRIKNERRLKGLENVLIDTYKTVFTSDDTEVQKKIFKPLVTTVADNTADLIDSIKKKSLGDNSRYFSNLASDYQFYLMRLGADGKGGIGVHSNGVTMQAQLDRLDDTDKVTMMSETGQPRTLRFGPGSYLVSEGFLGATNKDKGKAINSPFDVADQHGENQNVSTDNINKQIMIKRNENSYTMSVYAMMAFRKIYTVPVTINNETQDLSYPSLFMSQPILEEYVRLRSTYDSNTGDFVSQKEIDKEVITELSKIFNFPVVYNDRNELDTLFIPPTQYEAGQDKLTGEDLVNSLTMEQALKDPNQQAAVLQHFFLLKSEAEIMQKYNGLINLSTSKLGVSNFNNIQRIDMLNEIANGTVEEVQNIDKLIGKYELVDFLTKERINELKNEGYVRIGDAYWLPTTLEGTMLINSLHSAQNIVESVFPYRSPFIDSTIRDLFVNNQKDPTKKSASNLKWKYEITDAMRNFFITLEHSKMFNNIEEERERIFIDKGQHFSLARIIDTLRIEKNDIIVNNELIRDFDLTVRMDGLPSIIQHFANSTDDYDKNIKSDAYKKLLANDTTVLGEFNGESYTPRKLAIDLFSYAYLADTQNGASNFRNYIYYGFLQEMGITKGLREIYNNLLNGDPLRISSLMETFKTQYFQHYPNRASIMSNKTHNINHFKEFNEGAATVADRDFNTFLKALTSFQLNETDKTHKPEFISIRNSSKSVDNKNKKYNLYKRDENGVYNMIDVLGDTAYNEYNANNRPVKAKKSNLETNSKKQATIKDNNLILNHRFDIEDRAIVNKPAFESFRTVEGIIESFSNSKNMEEQTPELYKLLNEVKDFIPRNIEVKFEKPSSRSNTLGSYNFETNTITFDPSIWEKLLNKFIGQPNRSVLAATQMREIFMEELIHATTVIELKKWVDFSNDATGDITLKENAPEHVKRLVALYEASRSEVPYNSKDISTYYSKNVYEFIAGMFVAPDYRARIEEKSPGIVAKFLDILRRFFRGMQAQKTGQVLSYKDQMFNDVRSLIKDYSEALAPLTQKDQDTEYQDLIGNNPGEKIKPTEVKPSLNNPAEFTNHSGGAYGGDTMWDQIGREFGVTEHKHYRDAGNTSLSQKLRNNKIGATILTSEQMEEARTQIKELLGIDYSIKSTDNKKQILQKNLQVRNFYQVYNADAVYAIAPLNSSKTEVSGGTNTAVQLGIKMNKPVYVWDINTESWYEYNTDQYGDNGEFKARLSAPTLTKNFAGIGTRDIENYSTLDKTTNKWTPRKEYVGDEKAQKAQQAIRDVYEKTFSKSREEARPSNTESSQNSKVSIWKGFWTRKDVENNPDKIFLFGDNFEDARTGYVPSSTQAVIRGLPNAIGISTKLNRGTKADSYLSDKDFGEVAEHITNQIYTAIEIAEETGKTIVIPEDGIGTGKAQLEKRAPKIFAFLQEKLKELKNYSDALDGDIGTINSDSNIFELGEVKKGKAVSNLTFVNTMDNKSNTIIKGYKINIDLPLGLEAYLSTEMQLEDYSPIKSNTIQIVYGDKTIRYPIRFGTSQKDVLENFKEDLIKRSQNGEFLEAIKKAFNIDNQQPNSKISWARKADNSYEVSSKGDKRFSALYARLKDGRTIEEAYQLDIKGFREQGNDWRLGKGKAPIRQITKEQSWNEYKNLWRTYLNENPDLKQDLIEKSKGKVLTDMFASTDVSQARALAEILNEENNTLDSRQKFTNFAQEAFKCK